VTRCGDRSASTRQTELDAPASPCQQFLFGRATRLKKVDEGHGHALGGGRSWLAPDLSTHTVKHTFQEIEIIGIEALMGSHVGTLGLRIAATASSRSAIELCQTMPL
jgi:hypothetical protein